MTNKIFLLAVPMLLLLTSCVTAPVMAWVKPGANQQSFNKDRYTCMREAASAAQPSAGLATGYNGSLYSYDVNAGTRNDLFNACMESKGWTYQVIQQSPALQ